MSLDRIRDLLQQLPSHSLVHGGSHSGKLYQNYPWPPLDVLPAHRNDTQQRLDWLLEKLGDVRWKNVVDVGCANGAMTIGLAKRGAAVIGLTPDPIERKIAEMAAFLVDSSQNVAWGDPGEWVYYRPCDIVLSLSVWKWVVRNSGFNEAERLLSYWSQYDTLIFESGLTDGGMDLGIGITKADIPDILRKHTGCEPELLGIEPREDGTEREVWRCRRSA